MMRDMQFSSSDDVTQLFDSLFVPVMDVDLTKLQSDLNKTLSLDPYQRSAGYFAMTGRDGLWKVSRGEKFILLCRHPNVSGEFLVFSPMGKVAQALVTITMTTLQKMGSPARLCRIETDNEPGAGMRPVVEDVLDWTYPVHTLDTALVAAHAGKGFQHFRQKLNALDQSRILSRDIEPEVDCPVIMQLVKEWAGGDSEKITPYQRQIDLFGVLPLAGRVAFYDGKLCGLAIWEETEPHKGLANAYAHLTLHTIKGFSQYIFLDMCAALARKGFSRVCIGGSETDGLERFKRNLCPVESVALTSWISDSKDERKVSKAA